MKSGFWNGRAGTNARHKGPVTGLYCAKLGSANLSFTEPRKRASSLAGDDPFRRCSITNGGGAEPLPFTPAVAVRNRACARSSTALRPPKDRGDADRFSRQGNDRLFRPPTFRGMCVGEGVRLWKQGLSLNNQMATDRHEQENILCYIME